jgi:hypothetical protein
MTRTIEFETELTGGRTLELPQEIASALPSSGKATVIVVLDVDPDDPEWHQGVYQQFLLDDSEEDASYDRIGV